jgi:hypothetical protein
VTTLLVIESANRRGQIQRTQRRIDDTEIIIGRSTRAQIQLADPRVALEHARISVAENAATLSAQSGRVRLNGRATTGAQLSADDRIEIGPFTVRVDSPPAGIALALTVQARAASSTDENPLTRLLEQRRTVSKRRLSYLLFFGVLAIFLGLPIAWDAINAFGLPRVLQHKQDDLSVIARGVSDRAMQSWNPGPVSRSHQTFQSNCRACHQVQDRNPFVSQLPVATQVLDQACLACHRHLSEHVPRAQLTGSAEGRAFANTRCASCHRDHKDQKMAPRMDALCATCHAEIKRVAVQATTENVTDFGADHPSFRISPINADTGKVERMRLGAASQERSNLRFNHKLHLERTGIRAPSGRKRMHCADCHEPADDGRLIAPVSMERHCRECHSLKFDCSREKRGDPLECRSGAREVPHGPAANVAATLREFYSRLALGVAPPDAGAPPDLPRMRPGAVLRYEDRQPVLSIADRQAKQAFDALFDELNVCGTCHYVRRIDKAPGWEVAPIRLTQVWMPAARFTHVKHSTMQCSSCHKVGESSEALDIAMPDVKDCRVCHVGSQPVLGKVTSDCATCHKFHGGGDVWNHMLQAQTKIRRASR